MSAQVLQGTTDSPLTAEHRCDRCGAQAFLRAVLAGGGELLFCAHHAREHKLKITELAVHIQDETPALEG